MTSRKKAFLICIALLVLKVIYDELYKKYKKYPPGPHFFSSFFFYRFLLIGKVLNILKFNDELIKKYGKDGILYQKILGMDVCKICSSKVARQILNNKSVLSRPVNIKNKANPSLHIEMTDNKTFPFSTLNGNKWENRRRLAQSILFRMCKAKYINNIINNSLEKVVFKEIDQIMENNELFYPSKWMKYLSFNTMFHVNFGRDIDINDELYINLNRIIIESFALFKFGQIYSIFTTFGQKILQFSSKYKEMERCVNERSVLYRKLIQLRQKECDTKNPETYVDYLLSFAENGKITMDEVEADIAAIFSAATDTTSSTLEFAIILSAKYPDVTKLVQIELISMYNSQITDDTNSESIRKFDINWLNKLTLFRAFVYEILRISCVAKVGLPHFTINEIPVDIDEEKSKYVIPKHCVVLYMSDKIHHSTNENWKQIDGIHLQNWINSDGNFEMNNSFILFGFGRRNCVGLQLALKEIYIILGYLLLNYKFSFKNNNDITIETTWNGVTIIDPPIGVNVQKIP